MSSSAPPEPPGLSVRLLGAFRVTVGARRLPAAAWRVRKAGTLVALLALAPGHRLHREQVLESLWPRLPIDASTNNFHQVLYFARRLLEPGRPRRGPSAYLRIEGGSVALTSREPAWVDVEAFEAAVEHARRMATPDALESALALYDGDLLPEYPYAEWAQPRRHVLRQTRLDLLVGLARMLEARGDTAGATAMLERAVRDEPAHEEAHVALMRLHAMAGDRRRAVQQYEHLRSALAADLGLEPSPAARGLYRNLLDGRLEAPRGTGQRRRLDGRAGTDEIGHAGLDGPRRNVSADDPRDVARGGAPDGRVTFDGTGGVEAPGGTAGRRLRDASAGRRPPRQMRPAATMNLPAPLTPFIGRDKEQDIVERLLATSRLVTLLGIGGTGKTRLAIEVAGRLAPAFEDVRLVDLAPVPSPRRVPLAVTATLGRRPRPGQPPQDACARRIGGRRVLLVLDNCEHVAGACADLAASLLSACPALRILATSRRALRIEGEATWTVPPLSLPDPAAAIAASDAVRLFEDRARTARLEFVPDHRTRPIVVDICRCLDGLPLAIELVAARLKVLSLRDLRARLGSPLALAAARARGAHRRHDTMRAAISWSYRHLTADERRVFERTSVFAGRFTLEAARAVCGVGPPASGRVLESIGGLLDKSMLVADEGPNGDVRYTTTNVLRAYGLERLAGRGESEAVRGRHARYFLRFVQAAEREFDGSDQQAQMRRVAADLDNVRAALRWFRDRGPADGLRLAALLWKFWEAQGQFVEGYEWTETMLARSHAETETRALALHGAAVLARRSDCAIARRLSEQSLALSTRLGCPLGVAMSLNNLGLIAAAQGDYLKARRYHEQSLHRFRAADNGLGEAIVLGNLAVDLFGAGDLAGAHTVFERSLERRQAARSRRLEAITLSELAELAIEEGDLDRAGRLLDRSLDIHRGFEGPYAAARTLTAMMRLHRRAGRTTAALEVLGRVFEAMHAARDIRLIAWALDEAALLAAALGHAAAALRIAGAAEAARARLGAAAVPTYRRETAQLRECAARALGDAAAAAAWAEGQEMSVDEAAAAALVATAAQQDAARETRSSASASG